MSLSTKRDLDIEIIQTKSDQNAIINLKEYDTINTNLEDLELEANTEFNKDYLLKEGMKLLREAKHIFKQFFYQKEMIIGKKYIIL